MSKNLETVKNIIAAWDKRDFDRYLGYLAEDIEYHSHVGDPPYRGKQAIREFLQQYDSVNTEVEWSIRNFAENGDKVLIEGLVRTFNTATGQPIRHEYMGIFEFRDGLVCGWRDYFQR